MADDLETKLREAILKEVLKKEETDRLCKRRNACQKELSALEDKIGQCVNSYYDDKGVLIGSKARTIFDEFYTETHKEYQNRVASNEGAKINTSTKNRPEIEKTKLKSTIYQQSVENAN